MRTKIFIVGLVCIFLTFCKSEGSPETPAPPSYPNISSFTANPTTIKRGTKSTLSWQVTNCTSVEIDQGIGVVSFTGSKEVDPLDDITYKLTAKNADGQSTRECSITVEDGADVVMISGPTWKESDWTFSYFGIAKNEGTYEASFVKIYIYLYNKNNVLIDYDYTYVDKTDLKPNEQSPWEESWWDDDNSIRNKVDKSKTQYEIEWSEYTFIVRTGKRSIYDR